MNSLEMHLWYGVQFIADYDAVAKDPAKHKLMQSRSLKGEWSKFTRVAVDEMAAATAELEASGVVLVGDGRVQAAAYLEERRQKLKQTMPTFFRIIAGKAASNNRKLKEGTAAH